MIWCGKMRALSNVLGPFNWFCEGKRWCQACLAECRYWGAGRLDLHCNKRLKRNGAKDEA